MGRATAGRDGAALGWQIGSRSTTDETCSSTGVVITADATIPAEVMVTASFGAGTSGHTAVASIGIGSTTAGGTNAGSVREATGGDAGKS